MPALPLNESASVVLDGSGNGTARVGPTGHGQTWHPAVASVRVNTNTLEAQVAIYVGSSATSDNFADATYTGSSGNSSDSVSATEVRLGSYVWAVWTGGDPGSQATLTVTGSQDI
jgi:hypothetical protein